MNALEIGRINVLKGTAEVSFGDDEGNYIWADVSFCSDIGWEGDELVLTVTDLTHTITETGGDGWAFDEDAVMQAIHDEFDENHEFYLNKAVDKLAQQCAEERFEALYADRYF